MKSVRKGLQLRQIYILKVHTVYVSSFVHSLSFLAGQNVDDMGMTWAPSCTDGGLLIIYMAFKILRKI